LEDGELDGDLGDVAGDAGGVSEVGRRKGKGRT